MDNKTKPAGESKLIKLKKDKEHDGFVFRKLAMAFKADSLSERERIKQEIVEYFEAYAAEVREEERSKLEGIDSLQEWITINRILTIMAGEYDLTGLKKDDLYPIEKLTDDIHGKLRKYILSKLAPADNEK